MKTIKIGEKEYTLEFTFEAAEHKQLVQMMFNVLSGAYVMRNGKEGEAATTAMVDGVSEMIADIPHISITAFYAGMLENNPVGEAESKVLMKQYMVANKLSYHAMYEFLKDCMEEDGFFDLSGIAEMVQQMNQAMEESVAPKKRAPKRPQDHKPKSTSTN